jgi:adenylylsulfate kinase-like enzyme
MKKKIYRNQGILFWVTGLAGSGKTTFAKMLKKDISNKFGPTIVISGDDFRKSFSLKGYTFEERKKIVLQYQKFLKIIINQKINIIFAVIGMVNSVRKQNRKIFKNYVEIFIKANLQKLKIKNKKKLYIGSCKNVVGKDIKPEFPLNPDITIYNDFKLSKKYQVALIYKKIQKSIKL